ncbi:DNA mismatch repair protein MutS, partial [Rickettsiales bacterium]|nr:DNA mismatch repair protein MutS [Rickettsiales bacterium]
MQLKQQSLIDFSKNKESKKINKVTPMMSQYLEVKERHKEYLLFYRMGDFYELFFDDAKVAAKNLGIALTKRGKLNEIDIPMCGVPYHSVQNYLSRLIKLGFKIAIAEQLDSLPDEKGKSKKTPKIFRRDVVRIITPGTILEESLLDEKKYNFLTSIFLDRGKGSIAWIDMTTGLFNVKKLDEQFIERDLNELIYKIDPGEIITTENIFNNIVFKDYFKVWENKTTIVPFTYFDEKNNNEKIKNFFNIRTLKSLGEIDSFGISASGALIEYLNLTQKDNIPTVSNLNIIRDNEFLEVDKISSQSLEIFSKINGEREGSLIDVVDCTVTAAGSRMLKEHLKNPLMNEKKINKRLDYVEQLINEKGITNKIQSTLHGLPDVERALSRISARIRNPRDMIIVSNFINKSLEIYSVIRNLNIEILNELIVSTTIINKLKILEEQISITLNPTPPISFIDGGIINAKVSKDLDNYRDIKNLNKKNIINLQLTYSKITGLNNLKIKYNNFHGYFVEINNKHSHKLTDCDETKFYLIQNTLHSARFQTDDLKNTSIEIDQAEVKAIELEKIIYDDLCSSALKSFSILSNVSESVSFIDVMSSYAYLSEKKNYTRPTFSKDRKLEIIGGRHPVVEKSLFKSGEQFIPNDCYLDEQSQTWLMTGPNMAGKSTFLRQTAIIAIMSQIGCFVPAKKVNLKIFDKIYTRVGASDDLSRGLSTFMTEMVETARILNGATESSLIILDELGRGTSNSDGLSLAWSILEFIITNINCITFFATHYKELAEIKNNFANVCLKTMKTKESNGEIIFMYKVIEGVSKSSFGLHVAKLAGIKS